MTFIRKNFWFYCFDWLEFFHQDFHRQLFSLENGFLFQNQLLYVQSIISVVPSRKISQCNCASCLPVSPRQLFFLNELRVFADRNLRRSIIFSSFETLNNSLIFFWFEFKNVCGGNGVAEIIPEFVGHCVFQSQPHVEGLYRSLA